MMVSKSSTSSDVRLAELMAALSIATDLGMGQPMEYALCSCILAVRLGDLLGLDEDTLRQIYYQALLRYIGCNVGTHTLAAIFGDEIALRADMAVVDSGRLPEVLNVVQRYIRQANSGASPLHLMRMLAEGLFAVPGIVKAEFAGHCEVAQRLADRLGFDEAIIRSLGQLYERWDGKGTPNGLKGEAITTPVLVVALAQDVILFHRLGGLDAALNIVRERKGTAYAPYIADCFCQHAASLMNGLDTEPSWETVLALEPGGKRAFLSPEQLDTACEAIADFADLKSPFTLGHSRWVAERAAEAGRRCGLPEADVSALRRAGFLHDVGKVGISAAIWVKPGTLSEREWEQVRMHPYYTERVFARSESLARLGSLASSHHERLDGSGYFRGTTAAHLSPAARVLAAANAYQALIEERPHRSAYSTEAAAAALRQEVRAGRLDGEAVHAVLAAAGHPVSEKRREMVAGLSERQIEILRLIARGHSMKTIARLLTISEKTVDNHIQHIYNKIGVSTRAGATLFAIEQDLLYEVES